MTRPCVRCLDKFWGILPQFNTSTAVPVLPGTFGIISFSFCRVRGVDAEMSRLGDGAEGFARSLAVATVAPGGTFAVGGALVLDEVSQNLRDAFFLA